MIKMSYNQKIKKGIMPPDKAKKYMLTTCSSCLNPDIADIMKPHQNPTYTCYDCLRSIITKCDKCGEDMAYCPIFKDPPNKGKLVQEKKKCVKFILKRKNKKKR